MRGVLFEPAERRVAEIRNPTPLRAGRPIAGLPPKRSAPGFLHQHHYEEPPAKQQVVRRNGSKGDPRRKPLSSSCRLRTGVHRHPVPTTKRNCATLADRSARPDFVVYEKQRHFSLVARVQGRERSAAQPGTSYSYANLPESPGAYGREPLDVAVLPRLRWKRTRSPWPVCDDTDGRVFELPTLREMLTVQPFPTLVQGT